MLYLRYFFQNKNSEFCAPLTSFDWNEVDPNLLGTASIDTTCTIWALEVQSDFRSMSWKGFCKRELFGWFAPATLVTQGPRSISLRRTILNVAGIISQTGQAIGQTPAVTGNVRTQLIAHDKEVYDIAFSRAGGGRDMFASVGKFHFHFFCILKMIMTFC